jgi:hypothetical protein
MKIFRRQARGQGGRSQEMIPDPGTWTAGVPPTQPVEPTLREGSRPDGRRTTGDGAAARLERERNQDREYLGIGGVAPATMLLEEMKPLVVRPAERHDVAGSLAAQPLVGQMMKLDSLPPAPWNRTRLRAAREDRPHLDELPPPRPGKAGASISPTTDHWYPCRLTRPASLEPSEPRCGPKRIFPSCFATSSACP